MPNPSFDIILCTYNGEKYLPAQLESIVNQCQLPEQIVWSDDGSTDSTASIITEFCLINNIALKQLNGPQKGPAANFLQAMQHCTADYAFFCDQDDVWLQNKIELFLRQMNQSNTPHLIFSDCWVWDGQDMKESFWQVERITPEHIYKTQNIIFRNVVQGASMAINKALIANTALPKQCMMHDWWLALSANAFANISIIRQPTMLYRQHQQNIVGANKKRSFKDKRHASQKINEQAIHFFESHAIKSPTKEIYKDFAQTQSTMNRLMFLHKYRPIRSNFRKTLTLWLSLLIK